MMNALKTKAAYRFARFSACRRGLAAIEFAFIAPIMILLFFGVIEGSSALSASRKTLLSTNTLADLVAQETEVTKANLDDLFIGMEDIIDQRDVTTTFNVVSVVLDPATKTLKVHWSYSSTGAQPYAAGATYTGPVDKTLLDDTSSIVVAETTYAYSSPISQKIIGALSLKKSSTRWPRRSAKVQYCVSAGSCTT